MGFNSGFKGLTQGACFACGTLQTSWPLAISFFLIPLTAAFILSISHFLFRATYILNQSKRVIHEIMFS